MKDLMDRLSFLALAKAPVEVADQTLELAWAPLPGQDYPWALRPIDVRQIEPEQGFADVMEDHLRFGRDKPPLVSFRVFRRLDAAKLRSGYLKRLRKEGQNVRAVILHGYQTDDALD